MKLDPNKTYKVFHSIFYRGINQGMFKTDLHCDEGKWYLVFEWTTNHDGEFPSIRYPAPMDDLHGTEDHLVLSFPVEIPENAEMTELLLRRDRNKHT